jgi:hypothetical protein
VCTGANEEELTKHQNVQEQGGGGKGVGVGKMGNLAQGCHGDDIGWTDRQMDGQTMAAGSFVTWTHYNVHCEVTWG